MLTLSKIINKKLLKSEKSVLVLSKTRLHTKNLISELDVANTFPGCCFSSPYQTLKYGDNSTVFFRDASEDTDILQFAGISFSVVVLVEYQEFSENVKTILKSSLRCTSEKSTFYGSNSLEFHGFVKLK